jgi:DNA-binding NtrC family response regulator
MTTSLFPDKPVLVVDDEKHFLNSVELILASNGITHVEICDDSRKVMTLLKKYAFSIILLDLNMPHYSGMDLLPQIIDDYPEIPVIVITAINDVNNAVTCMKSGAFDYILKPVDETRLVSTIRRGLDLTEIRNENQMLKQYLLHDRLEFPEAFAHIYTRSEQMRPIFKYTEAISQTNLPVVITGETGVGKELIAAAVHHISGRSGEFVAVNVAGVDDTLFSDTLFGHKKGAFTGAEADRRGMIEQAAGGTLFLDEIGDLSLESQVKLLRLLQDGTYYSLGSDIARVSDARIIVATNRDIQKMQATDHFRKDLYYRLKAHHINIPPLRERKTDIPVLVNHFLETAADALGKKKPTAPRELFTLLANYHFPGNIRELEGMIFDAVSVHKSGILSLKSFREKLSIYTVESHAAHDDTDKQIGVGEKDVLFSANLPTLKEMENLLIAEAMERANGNQRIAADLLGISRTALNNRLQRSKND